MGCGGTKGKDLQPVAPSKAVNAGPPGAATGESTERSNSEGTSGPSVKVTSADITKAIPEIETFDGKRFEAKGKLQDALRNQGQVVKMVDTQAQGEFAQIAMKQMPNAWVLDSKKFPLKHPEASEKPWFDIGCVCYLNSIDYPYACKLMGVFRDSKTTYVATTLCTEGDLFSWCEKDPPPGKDRELVIFPIVVQLCIAVRWLHELGVVHRDISLENILLTDEEGKGLRVKLIDFGMSTLDRLNRRELCGKESYQAPEMHMDNEYDGFLTDAFAVGVAVFCVAAKDYPWFRTKAGGCKRFDYVRTYGLRNFLERRKLRNGDLFLNIFSEPFFDFVSGLTCLEAPERTVMGEADWGKESRGSVWDSKWMEPVAAR